MQARVCSLNTAFSVVNKVAKISEKLKIYFAPNPIKYLI